MSDDEEYNEWLNTYKDHGLSFEDWKQWRSLNESESSKNKYQYSDTVIDKSVIDSADYRKRMDGVSDDIEVNRSAWKSAREMLNHRSGTKYEDLAFIDSTTGKYKINKSYSVESRASMNKTLKKMLADAEPYTIIAVHNHPGSSVPSIADIQTCLQRKYKCGVVVCHDGKIYKYSVNTSGFNDILTRFTLARMQEEGYTESVQSMFKDAGVVMEEL